MRLFGNMAEKIKTGIQSWLRIQPAVRGSININETLNLESNAIKNRIWYRGDGDEIKQLYGQIDGEKTRFWSAVSTVGMEIRKIHVGIPSIIVDTLTNIVAADMNDIKLSDRQDEWELIADDNKFYDLLSDAITDTLYIGDGAFKISFDPGISKYPIIEFYPGDRVEYVINRGRIQEIIYKTVYHNGNTEYVLLESYGYGYITYQLTKSGQNCNLTEVPEVADLKPITWQEHFIMGVSLKFFRSSKWKGRGKSIFDDKIDAFDSLDEAWSQWMDALRKNRTKEYIPANMLPRNPKTGEVLMPNAFDNAYIKVDNAMQEGVENKIDLEQGNIPHESYLATYITALDLCLQGLISPSTLGIDVKKLDNADAQREKEKATLYTRNKIVEALQNNIPELVNTVMKVYDTLMLQPVEDLDVEVPFGEYANPSFESQVETVSKGKTGGIMSIEASVEELYGDSKDEEWKAEEVARLKAEQGVSVLDEPAVNNSVGDFSIEQDNTDNSILNGAQVTSLMNVISMIKAGELTRTEGISIITSTLGVTREHAETFIEDKL